MRSKFRLIILAIGVSLISGVIAGNYYKLKEYELFNPYSDQKIILKSVDDITSKYKIHEIFSFNMEKAMMISILTFGISLVGISFVKTKS